MCRADRSGTKCTSLRRPQQRGHVALAGRALDYASRFFLTKVDPLYSNRSNVMLRIVEDTVGRHAFLLTPCAEPAGRCPAEAMLSRHFFGRKALFTVVIRDVSSQKAWPGTDYSYATGRLDFLGAARAGDQRG